MNPGWRCRARSTNSRRASSDPSESSRQTVSPLTPNDSRLVAKIRKLPQAPSNDDASSAHASTTCSQLSITSSMSRSTR
jgi:hypothetical protein